MVGHNLKIAGADAPLDIAPGEARLFLNEATLANAPVTSQARVLQEALVREFAEDAPKRWPVAMRIAIIFGGSAVLWGGIFAAASRF